MANRSEGLKRQLEAMARALGRALSDIARAFEQAGRVLGRMLAEVGMGWSHMLPALPPPATTLSRRRARAALAFCHKRGIAPPPELMLAAGFGYYRAFPTQAAAWGLWQTSSRDRGATNHGALTFARDRKHSRHHYVSLAILAHAQAALAKSHFPDKVAAKGGRWRGYE